MPPLNGSQVTRITPIYDIEIQTLNYGWNMQKSNLCFSKFQSSVMYQLLVSKLSYKYKLLVLLDHCPTSNLT